MTTRDRRPRYESLELRRALIADRLAQLRVYDARTERELEDPPQSESDARRKEAVRLNLAEARTLAAELQTVLGVLATPSDLLRVRVPYPEAIPVLLRQFERTDLREDVWQTVLRCLDVPYAGRAVFDAMFCVLRERYAQLHEQSVFTLGYVIGRRAAKRDRAILVEIAEDRRYDGARMEPILRLARWRDPAGIGIARASLAEGNWAWTGLKAVRYARDWDAAPLVEPFLRHADAELRTLARDYFKALGAHHA